MIDPENWLETNSLIDLINSDDFQDRVTLWICGSWREEEFEGEIPWSLALKQTMNLLEGGIRRMRNRSNWNDVINYALGQCDSQEMKDCGLFWIAHYAVMKGVVNGKIHLKHCTLSAQLAESEQEGT
jgi:hypothetical protein